MYLKLHKLCVHLQSDDALIRQYWQYLFAGWSISATAAQEKAIPPADIRFQLQRVETLPALPPGPPFFSDRKTQAGGDGILSVYKGKAGHVLLHYLDGAVVEVPLAAAQRQTGSLVAGVVTGVVTKAAINNGRLEDIIYTSLAPLLRRHGYFLVHAFAAGHNGRAVLFVGPSGSGKTTSGLSLILGGWRLFANDILLLQKRPSAVYALPTPGTAGVRARTLQLLPKLAPLLKTARFVDDRYELTNQKLANGRWPSPAPISTIYFPQIDDRPYTKIASLSRALCLARLMEESVDRWDTAMLPDHVNLLQTVSRQAAAYTLHLGQDVTHLPALLEK